MWPHLFSLLYVVVVVLCTINNVHLEEVFETTTVYEQNSTVLPSRSKYECDTSDETTNLQIFVSVCKCLVLKNSEISIHKQVLNESSQWEIEDCLKKVEEAEDKLAALYDKKSLAKNYTQEAEMVIQDFKNSNPETAQNLICQKSTAENSIIELELPAKIVCEAFRFLRQVIPAAAAEIRSTICSS